jgi:hypothetical protein
MENPEKMSAPDPALDANIDAMNVATPGKDAPNLDKTAPKRALFSSPSAVAHNKTNISTPTTTDKRNTRERKKNLMDNRHMKLADNEQMGDVRKQLRFNEEVRVSANARKDMLQRRMIEMKRMEMEVRRQMAELAEKHMRQMEEMKMRTTQMTQKAEWMKEIIGQQQMILEQQQTTLEQLQMILEQVASVNDLVCRRLQQRFKEEQEQEKEQQRQQQEENKEKEQQEQQEQQEEGEEQQEEEQQQQAAATALAGSSTSRQQQQQAIAEQEQRDQQEHRVQIDAKWLSARADRRLAALQRQEREREAQQWVEQLRNREPKASGNKRAALRYLTREIGTVAGILAGTDSISH